MYRTCKVIVLLILTFCLFVVVVVFFFHVLVALLILKQLNAFRIVASPRLTDLRSFAKKSTWPPYLQEHALLRSRNVAP